ncbi:InlB B-repeat-containing protein [bacterium 210820-DFI.6.38]|nr:InlB B-repeat-containing protein [bacterium 210820-DFI.6.38]
MKLKKRILSLLLCGAMLFSLCPQSVLAKENGQAGGVTAGTSGLCEHHPEHNADCGYTEGIEGTPCNHEHTEDCYTLVTECVHEHDEDCYPEESVSGNEATPSGAQKREPTECTHACSEESGCSTKELNCQHEHDDECGYSPAAEGTPCGYVCELCGAGDNTPSNAEAVTVASVQAMIDALPSAEAITEENAEEVKAQLEAIDEAKEKLSDEEIDELDMTRYAEAAAALGALAAPMLLANDSPDEQFSLKPGDTYYFDLSGANIPGTANGSLPDSTLHYVPFTYAGTVDAYKLTSAMATTEEYAQQNKYAHSLFVADYAVTHKVNWNNLDTASLIFGKNYASGGVDYTLRAPSVGSGRTGSDESQRGTPQSNEWDTILDKDNGYIKNWSEMSSWGQDTVSAVASFRAIRGYGSARRWSNRNAADSSPIIGFRPVLEVLNADTLGFGGLKAVTLDLNGGKLGGSSDAIQIIVKNGSAFTAPASDGMTRPDGNTGSYFMWLDGNGNSYEPGDSVPADVTTLTVQWTAPTYAVTLNTGGGTINSGNVTEYTYGVGATLPAADDMTYTGHTFKGWYDNESLTSSPVTAIGSTETGNKEYWAKWEANTYTVTLNTNGGTINSGNVTGYTYGVGATLPTADDMTYTGYTFKGWYDNEGLTGFPVTAISDTETGNKEYWAKWEANAYTVTLNTNGGTINNGNVTEYTYGAGATLPTADDMTYTGHTFVGWYDNENLTGSPVTAIGGTETGNKEYWAKWEANTYTVTFYPNGGSVNPVAATTDSSGKLSSLPTPTRGGNYRFDGWYTEQTGGIKVTLNQVYTADTTLYAYWIYTSGSSSSEDRDDPSGNAFITDRPNKDNPTTPTTAKSNSVKVDSKGNAVITRSIVADVISVAQSDSIKHGNTKNGIAVVVPVEISKALAGVQITLKADALDKLVSSGVKRFTIDTDSMADFGFMLDTLKELNRQTTGDLILKMKKTAVTSQEVETAIGNRPVYDITLWEVKNGKETAVNLSGKTVSIAIPYTPAKNEKPGNLYAVYVDENGNVQWISKSSYNMDQKAVIFVAEHFSIYGIGYKNQIPAFTDVNNHWAKDNMLFVVSRGLLSGTSATTFSPNIGMTRGMFVTALGRLAGVDPTDYQASMFTDVKEDAYYAPYVNWAAKTGVVSGTTDTTFAPDTNINREQMAVIMKNYATKLGYTIPKTLEVVNFADSAGISSWAKEAVKSMQQAGILAGKTNNCFDPAGTATRAEVATVLRRFVEIVIDPQTANGWVQNDSGEWSYYKNGDLVKGWLSNDQKWYWLDKNTGKMFSGGWKQIDGKQYYFYADGSMAVSTKVGGYEVGADGARK